jgi:hypothetical protein
VRSRIGGEALETMRRRPVVGTIRRITRSYGILGPAMIAATIILIIVGIIGAAHHDQIF